MVKNKEIQEFIQQIRNEYQEGIDFELIIRGEIEERGVAWVDILSPRLKKYCREKFNFPLSFNDYLDYHREYIGGWFTYRTIKDTTKYDYHDFMIFSKTDYSLGESKICAVCDELTFTRNGWMKLWDGEFDEEKPNVIGYFHPECAKKYFPDKKQTIKDWANGSTLPVKNQKTTNTELANLKNIFQQHNIKKIIFENEELFIEYNNINPLENCIQTVNKLEFQVLEDYCRQHNEREISWERLNSNSTNDTKSSPFKNKYLWLAGGIILGIIVSGILVLSLRRKKRKIK